MATVYEIEIETVSPWVCHPEKDIEELFKKFLDEYKDEKYPAASFESTNVKVRIKA
jgi:hypothetical protein